MGFKVVYFLIFWLIKSTLGANETCSETQCKLFIDGNDLSAEFLSKSSEHGVRMVYLHLNVGSERYNPLQSHERFFPDRWTWARDVGEPMLSFSYQYQVLSLGLLKNQVRTMKVVLNDEPRGCLANLTSSCKDLVVSRTLLEKVAHDSKSPLHSEDVVCVSVVRRDMDWLTEWYYGNVEYRCCKKEKRENGTVMQCDLPVKEHKWLSLFYHELTIGIIVAFFFWPAGLISLPDSLFMSSEQQKLPQTATLLEQKSCEEILGDDQNPITCTNLIKRCTKPFPEASNFFKLFFFCYILIPIFGYIFFALNYLFLSDFLLEIGTKHAIQENVLFYYFFEFRGNLYCLIPAVIFFLMPGNLIYFESRFIEINKLKSDLASSLQELAKMIINAKYITDCISKYKNNLGDKFCGPHRITKAILDYLKCHCKTLYCFATTVVIIIYGLMLMFCAVYGIVCVSILLIIFLLMSLKYTVYYSPFVVLMKFIKNVIEHALLQTKNACLHSRERPWKKIPWTCYFVGWIIYFSLAVSICSRFFIRMIGFVIMGLIINAQRTTPYVIFMYVLTSNISTNYSNYQNRFKKVKKMICKQYQKNATINPKTIPEKLFWSVCNEHKILPFQQETCGMLITMFIISSILFLALAVIVFFGEEYKFSPLISAAAVFLSGKIPDLILKRESFKGWSKIRKEQEIKEAIDAWINKSGTSNDKQKKDNVDIKVDINANANTQ